jgi:adenylyltransferase/sulfurtransferase
MDNFETRYVLNRYCHETGLPLVHAGVYGMAGQVSFIQTPETPCLRCIFPEAPAPELFPVVGAAVGVIGCVEALEAIKSIAGLGTLLKGRLLIWEGDIAKFEEISFEKSPSCPVCG